MAAEANKMLSLAIEAFVKVDVDLAKKTIESDDIVDNLFIEVRQDIINSLKSETDCPELALDLLMISKYLERIGDHAVNVSEWVIFSITGVHKHEVEK